MPFLAYESSFVVNGGEGGIRTLGTDEGTHAFQASPFDRSGTSPLGRLYCRSCGVNAIILALFLLFILTMSEIMHKLQSYLQSFLPRGECFLCLEPANGFGLCNQCIEELPIFNAEQRISYISLHKPYALPLEVYSLFRYQWPIADMQHRFKYRRDFLFGHSLAQILAHRLSQESLFSKDSVLVPMPMHWWRRWRRGSNHAQVQAKTIASALGLTTSCNLLKLKRATKTQVGLSKKQRQKNLSKAFFCSEKVRDKKILLFDDVVTTGSSMREVARTIYKAGAAEVRGLSIARGEVSP